MYQAERDAFRTLKGFLNDSPSSRREVEVAFARLLGDYATSIRENRFVVGGAAEVIVCAAMRAAGVHASDATLTSTGGDISLPGDVQLSVKGRFSDKASSLRILNVLGASTAAAWQHGTLFMLSGVGIVYADPDLLPHRASRTSDAVTLSYRHLRAFLEANEEWVIRLDIPFALTDASRSRLTSRTVAFEILRGLPTLRSAMPTSEQ